jgi:hypothetical protein
MKKTEQEQSMAIRINTTVEAPQSARKKRLGVTWPEVLERGLRGFEQDRRDREAAKKEGVKSERV